MIQKILFSFLLGTLGCFAAPTPAAEVASISLSESGVTAKRSALDFAEVLLNEGFRIRDGAWNVSLAPHQPLVLQVTLFAGNQYWFLAAAAAPAQALQITLYDATGHPLKADRWKGETTGAKAAEGFLAPHSGKYFVKLELLKSQNHAKADACLVYAYK